VSLSRRRIIAKGSPSGSLFLCLAAVLPLLRGRREAGAKPSLECPKTTENGRILWGTVAEEAFFLEKFLCAVCFFSLFFGIFITGDNN
jgi:hypothetical protein